MKLAGGVAYFVAILTMLSGLSLMADPADIPDPYLWLEEVEGDKALAWVRERNAIAARELEATPSFAKTNARVLAVYDSEDRIPYIVKRGEYYYNFWRDKQHVRGIWRRTTLDEYRKPNPQWETVLDIDALAREENENWVWGGALQCLPPNEERCLLQFSRGGGDTKVVREFDVVTKQFVRDGFNLPAAKSDVAWRDRDSLYVSTDFGPGSLTTLATRESSNCGDAANRSTTRRRSSRASRRMWPSWHGRAWTVSASATFIATSSGAASPITKANSSCTMAGYSAWTSRPTHAYRRSATMR